MTRLIRLCLKITSSGRALFLTVNASDWDIRMADISKPNEPLIYVVTGIANNDEQNPAIHGNIVVWEDGLPGNIDIYGADITELSNPREFLVTGVNFDQRKPAILQKYCCMAGFFRKELGHLRR